MLLSRSCRPARRTAAACLRLGQASRGLRGLQSPAGRDAATTARISRKPSPPRPSRRAALARTPSMTSWSCGLPRGACAPPA